jgi:hypothetical protein
MNVFTSVEIAGDIFIQIMELEETKLALFIGKLMLR